MNIAVRYYSRSGNTKALAEAIAKEAAVPAVSVDQDTAGITEPVDLLFIGGALYAYGLDSHLKDYLQKLNGACVGRAVIFSTSWISKHAIGLIRKELAEKGISVDEEAFYVKNRPDEEQLKRAALFAKEHM